MFAMLKEKLQKLRKNEKLRKFIIWTIFILVVFFSLLTFLMFSVVEFRYFSSTYIIVLLNIDLFLLLLLAGLVTRKVVKLWVEKRRNISGSSLHMRLVVLFMFVAGVPTIIVTVFSAIFFNIFIKSWFSEQVQTAVSSSLVVAEDYYKESRQNIANDVMIISQEINNGFKLLNSEKEKQNFLYNQIQRQHIKELVLMDPLGNVLMHSGDMSSLKEDIIPKWIFAQANNGGIAINLNAQSDKIRALIKLHNHYDMYLYIGRAINPEIIDYISKAKTAINNYQNLEGQSSFLEITFTVIFIAIALVLFLLSVWIGLGIATKLISPIGLLIATSEKVAKGEDVPKVPELDIDDELGQLVRAFNNMTAQISMQKNELISKNIDIDSRRRLIEAILAGVSSGIVNVTKDMKIRMANVRACEMLGDLNKYLDIQFDNVVPELKNIITELENNSFKSVQENIEVTINGVARQFFVRVIGEYKDKNIDGYVFTFDDMTELEQAQRKAAWGDVARRIAHEIKNPLTPIQLAAERLLKKYKDKIDDNAFLVCINTIIRQVGDIGRMVDEFARFSKMPTPKLTKCDLMSVISEEILLQQQVYPFINYELKEGNYSGDIVCDKGQIAQVITNLLKNSAESLVQKQEKTKDFIPSIKVSLKKEKKYVITVIEDNGKGIAETNLHRVTEPYVTTKAKGTGIGLAIVKKIVEDHKGQFNIENRARGGVKVTFTLAV